MDTPTTDVGPGLGAFIAFFALAVVLWFLLRNMNARMRRMGYAERERVERLERLDAQEREREGGDPGRAAGRSPEPGAGPSGGTTPQGAPPPGPDEEPPGA